MYHLTVRTETFRDCKVRARDLDASLFPSRSSLVMLADLNTAMRTPLTFVQNLYEQNGSLEGLEKRVEEGFSALFADATALAQASPRSPLMLHGLNS